MKKSIRVLMALVVAAAFLCAGALAQESRIPEPIPLATQIETMDVSVDTSIMVEELLLGEFREMYYFSSRSGLSILDSYDRLNENYGISFDADGTAIAYHLDEDDEVLYYHIALSGGNMNIQLVSADTGELYETCVLMIRENMNTDAYRDHWNLLKDGSWYLTRVDENNDYHFYSKEWEASEELAPALTNVSMEDFDGEWLYAGGSYMGREIIDNTYEGTVYRFDIEDSEFCNYYGLWGGSNMFASEYFDFDRLSSFEDGVLTIEQADSTNWGGENSIVECRLHEDGTMSMAAGEYIIYRYERNSIDPLTEYDCNDGYNLLYLQETLNELGYDCGTPDGVNGSKTKAAISAFQTDSNISVTGTITEEMLRELRAIGYDYPGGRFTY